MSTLLSRLNCTQRNLRGVVHEVRCQRLLEQPLDYVCNDEFNDPALKDVILAEMPGTAEYEARRQVMRAPHDIAIEVAPLYKVPLLDKSQEQHLFRKMNYLKHKAAQLRRRLVKDKIMGGVDPSRVHIQDLQKIEELQSQANEVKDQLISANMRLVANIAKRYAAQSGNFWELLSDGNMSLMRAVEKFDYGRGFKFSTYASWAIINNYRHDLPVDRERRERFATGCAETLNSIVDASTSEAEQVETMNDRAELVARLLACLCQRERDILRMRTGLGGGSAMSLTEIGVKLGISKERVRQLSARAARKLRAVAEEEGLEWSRKI